MHSHHRPYRVNLDYEYTLWSTALAPKTKMLLMAEFEYIYFFINKNSNASLATDFIYEPSYLEQLDHWGMIIPPLVATSSKDINWWGDLKDAFNEKRLGSKNLAYKMAKELGLCPLEATLVGSENDLISWIGEHPSFFDWILKADGRMGGQGHLIFKQQEALESEKRLGLHKAFLKGERVLAPYYKRIYDVGSTIDLETMSFYSNRNFINRQGNFKGGYKIAKDLSFGPKELMSRLNKALPQIAKSYSKEGARGNIQIDSFNYIGGDYLLVEMNYRKTMGAMIHALDSFAQNRPCVWVLLDSAKWAECQSYTDLMASLGHFIYKDGIGVLPTSPLSLLDKTTKEHYRIKNIGFCFFHENWKLLGILVQNFKNYFYKKEEQSYTLLDSIAQEFNY